VNSNVLTDELTVDPLSGNSVLNGIPVAVKAAERRDDVRRSGATRAEQPR